jgi:hypothetical protein
MQAIKKLFKHTVAHCRPSRMLLANDARLAPARITIHLLFTGDRTMNAPSNNAPAMSAQAPALRHLCRITARVSALVSLGDTAYGERRSGPFGGGDVVGGARSGDVVAGGTDGKNQRHDGTLDISAQYVIRTSDGALVEVESRGYRHGPAEVMARLAQGEPVAPDAYYFRTAMRFQTGAPAWRYLNSVLAIGKAMRRPDAAVLDVFLVG